MKNLRFDKTIVIVGPTASGKTGVAIEIAKEIARRAQRASEGLFDGLKGAGATDSRSAVGSAVDGVVGGDFGSWCGLRGAEVISADSRAIYRGMELGTAAPSQEEQAGVPHFGVGIVEPGERFTVADWKKYAEQKICEIRARGNLPMVVGGTGLYVDALIYDYQFSEQKKLDQSDRREMNNDFLVVGIDWPPEQLRERITLRADKLFVQELFEETRKLVAQYKWDIQAMKSNIYQFAWAYLQGEYDLERAKELFIYDDWHLAKRQLTWFKRNKNIKWLPLAEVQPYVLKCIQDEQRR